jgi:hypothetical protein
MNSLYQNVTSKHLVGVTAILEKFFSKIDLAIQDPQGMPLSVPAARRPLT